MSNALCCCSTIADNTAKKKRTQLQCVKEEAGTCIRVQRRWCKSNIVVCTPKYFQCMPNLGRLSLGTYTLFQNGRLKALFEVKYSFEFYV